ncbi:MAG: heavy metal response regulator transcription factor [Gemmataceae bacterium]|nr:heavy metal response regulator transcription factor [Gemmataceae bacterium]
MKILVIEDEKKTAAYLRKGLTENGFGVDVAPDGPAGLRLALTGTYQLIILDVMLPGLDGWAVLSELRQAQRHTPVIFLTARDAVRHRVKGLELGADDYLVKPFAFSELLARIRTILRRQPDRPQELLRVGDLEIDLLGQKATRGGVRLELSPKEFALLSCLASRPGEVLSRSFLAKQVWDVTLDSEMNVVNTQVRRLRAKVDDPFPTKLIQTVRGVGYVLQPP